jgi:hypothetical protein
VDTRITLGRCVADSVVEAGNSSDELLVGTNVAVRIGDRVGDECPVFVLVVQHSEAGSLRCCCQWW